MDRVEELGESARVAVEFITDVDPNEAASEARVNACWSKFLGLNKAERGRFLAKLKFGGHLPPSNAA